MMSGQRQQYYTTSVTMKVENLTKVYSSSGSGKSTLLNMLGALDRPTSGKVFLDGIDIFSLNDSQLATVRNDKLYFSIV
jgi:ABC-type lipoprotein export system ATPase subunit